MTKKELDIKIKLHLTIAEMYCGLTKKLKITRMVSCKKCRKPKDCNQCNEKGLIKTESIEEIMIPAGIDEGMTLVLKDKGHTFAKKTSILDYFSISNRNTLITKGDLKIIINASEHDVFTRENFDLIYLCKMSNLELTNSNGNINIILPDNEIIKVKIPQDSIDGRILRIRDKGFSSISTSQKGDLYIKLKITSKN